MESQRESIFKSSFRRFCHSFFIITGLLIAAFFFMLLVSFFPTDGSVLDKYRVTLLPNADDKIEMESATVPVVLRIDIKGVIGQKKLRTEEMYNLLLESRKGLLTNNRVKAIFLHINSPGGSVNDTDGIYRLLLDYKRKHTITLQRILILLILIQIMIIIVKIMITIGKM